MSMSDKFTLDSCVALRDGERYDHAGLMVRKDSMNWQKCGLELVDHIGHASVVLTREFSDWSTIRGITTREPLWWRIVGKDSSLEVFALSTAKTSSPRASAIFLCQLPSMPASCAVRPKELAANRLSTKSV